MTTNKKSTKFFNLDVDEYEVRKKQAEDLGISIDYFIMEFCEIYDVTDE